MISLINKRFNQLRILPLIEWQLLVTSTILLPLTALGLGLFGLNRTHRFMEIFTPTTAKAYLPEKQKFQDSQMVARIVSIAANHSIYRANCLKKSLVLWWLLKRKGIKTNLYIGVQKEGKLLNAHAWVEMDGNTLFDDGNITEGFYILS